MELRKDPITRSWVITGDDPPESGPRHASACLFCDGSSPSPQVIAKSPNAPGVPWSARSVVHPKPLYRIEGEPDRRGDGIYDCMHSVGAHEVLVENPSHDRHLWNASDDEIAHFLRHRERISNRLVDDRMYRSRLGTTKEREAEELAFDLLMPRALIGEFRSAGMKDPEQLAERFNVPLHVMKRRLGIKD